MMKAMSFNSSGVVEFQKLLDFQGLDILLEWPIKSFPGGSWETSHGS